MVALDGKTVLVVDDEPDMRDLIQASLKLTSGCRVVTAGDLSSGVAAARRERPDVALLDVMMPGGDGRDMLRRLRADPQTAAIPVFFITTRAGAEHQAEYLSLGAQGVIAKPFDPIALGEQIAGLLSAPGQRTNRLAELRQRYEQRLPGKLAVLVELTEQALEQRTTDAARHEAHKLAGSAGSYGFPDVSRVSRDLECTLLDASGTDWGEVQAHLDELRRLREHPT